jgi:FKBP-type peptidyl-prolyl cis-trans isomerase
MSSKVNRSKSDTCCKRRDRITRQFNLSAYITQTLASTSEIIQTDKRNKWNLSIIPIKIQELKEKVWSSHKKKKKKKKRKKNKKKKEKNKKKNKKKERKKQLKGLLIKRPKLKRTTI